MQLRILKIFFQLYRLWRSGQFYWWRKPEYREKHRPVTRQGQILSHNVVQSTPHHEWGSYSKH